MIDPPPPTDAKKVIELLDQRPLGRDPYGWVLLRTLGLAVGFRLFDMTTGDFVDPNAQDYPGESVKTGKFNSAIGKVYKAFYLMRKRYPDLVVGAPTLDMLVRAEGLYNVASFDGAVLPPQSSDAFGEERLSLMQISLRPTAEQMLPKTAGQALPKEDSAALYFRVAISSAVEKIEILSSKFNVKPFLVDVIDNSNGFSSGGVIAVAAKDDTIARNVLGKGRVVREAYTLSLASLPNNPKTLNGLTQVLLIRVTTTFTAALAETVLRGAVTPAPGVCIPAAAPPPNCCLEGVTAPSILGDNAARIGIDAFQLFPELPPSAIAALIFGDLEAKGPDGTVIQPLPLAAAREQFDRFKVHASARFPTDPLTFTKNDEAEAFFTRWPDLARRFLNNGPAFLKHSTAQDDDDIAFSFGLVPRPQPFRAKVESDGTMQIILVHQDKLATKRRYVVRPFSRYDNLMAAWDASAPASGGSLPWVSRRNLADSIEPPPPPPNVTLPKNRNVTLPQIKREELDKHSVDIVAPRSEPLAPPVILSARRLDLGGSTSQRPGQLMEWVVARHQEEIASEANSTVADSLQFEHVAFGFWREFAHPTWGDGLKPLAKVVDARFDFNPLPAAPSAPPLDPLDLSFSKPTSFDEQPEGDGARAWLPARIVDGWRGITVLRTQRVPHFYRVHLAAFAAAGVVVSPPVVATVVEGRYGLPDPKDLDPRWSVAMNGGALAVKVSMPLVSLADGMSNEERALWLPPDPVERRVYQLPDPDVVYELSTRYGVPKENGDIRPADVVAEATYSALTAGAGYLLKTSGGRFNLTSTHNLSPVWESDAKPWWLEQALIVPPPSPPSQPSPPSPDAWKNLTQAPISNAGIFDLDALHWNDFAPFAPIRAHVLTIAGPLADNDRNGWNGLAAAVEAYRQTLKAYGDAATGGLPPFGDPPGLDALLAHIVAFASKPVPPWRNGWNQVAQNLGVDPNGPLKKTLDCRAGVKLDAGDARIGLTPAAGSTWTLGVPADTSYPTRAKSMAALSLAQARATSTSDKLKSLFVDPLASALWTWDHWKVLQDNKDTLNGFPILSRELPSSLEGPATAAAAAIATSSPGLEFIARIDLVTPAASLWPPSPGCAPFDSLLNYFAKRELYAGKPGVGFGAALESLMSVELAGGGRAQLFIPVASLAGVLPLLDAIKAAVGHEASVTPMGAVALVLRRPPTDDELAGLTDGDLQRFARGLAADQIFGVDRRPFLKANKGLLDAIVLPIRRVGE